MPDVDDVLDCPVVDCPLTPVCVLLLGFWFVPIPLLELDWPLVPLVLDCALTLD